MIVAHMIVAHISNSDLMSNTQQREALLATWTLEKLTTAYSDLTELARLRL